MKELEDIVNAYRRAKDAPMVLVSVVAVEGSSYRRPGARMLVREDGSLVGAISGGCLEGDARRKAMFALAQSKNRFATYDTTDEDGEMFGIQLGCHGVVSLLFEPILPDMVQHPLTLLESLVDGHEAGCLATLFAPDAAEGEHPGTCLLHQKGSSRGGDMLDAATRRTLAGAMEQALAAGSSTTLAAGAFKALLHIVPAAVRLVIAGAGNDAMPLVRLARELGWQVTVVDGRATHATPQRFPAAQTVTIVKAGDALPAATAYVLMSHNFPYDLAALRQLKSARPRYIGVLGPAQRRDELLEALGGDAAGWGAALHGPAGLDIGAETAEEIALAILAEIKATLEGAPGTELRDKAMPIHSRVGR